MWLHTSSLPWPWDHHCNHCNHQHNCKVKVRNRWSTSRTMKTCNEDFRRLPGRLFTEITFNVTATYALARVHLAHPPGCNCDRKQDCNTPSRNPFEPLISYAPGPIPWQQEEALRKLAAAPVHLVGALQQVSHEERVSHPCTLSMHLTCRWTHRLTHRTCMHHHWSMKSFHNADPSIDHSSNGCIEIPSTCWNQAGVVQWLQWLQWLQW